MTDHVVPRRDRFGAQDVLTEAVRGLPGRPGRLLLAVLTVTLGVGSLVATLGFAQTGAHQVAARFDAFASTRLVAAPAKNIQDDHDLAVMPWDSDERALRLNGVVAAGLICELDSKTMVIKAVPLNDPEAIPLAPPAVVAVTPGLFSVVDASLVEGTFINAFHQENAELVAVLGANAATTLGITRVDNQPAIFINNFSLTVIGILDTASYHPELQDAVIIPLSSARNWFGLGTAGQLDLDISLGAGDLVASQLPTMLNPNDPSGYAITKPVAASVIRSQLSGDVDALFLGFGLIALVIGSLTTAAITSLAVMERRGEIGLRRALGATRGQIGAQFLTETGIIGLLGGLLGAAGGVLVVVGVCAANSWTPILDVRITVAATLLGLVAGTTAGVLPAIKAARTEPATTLQAGT
ncbi:MAG: ABC transporter permease [Propionibacteriaceae bacterium]|nr:ABC transporter permease [Propionibacteriaceae bacterium]